jgi:hypothetical protein
VNFFGGRGSFFVAILLGLWMASDSLAGTGAVARLAAISGGVQIRRGAEGRWLRAKRGGELTLADSVRTQKGALARIEFFDAIDGAKATIVDLADAAEVSIAQFEITKQFPKRRMGLLDVVYGTLRAFTKGWKRGSVFSVRAGTTVCGIRGSSAVISVSPTGQVAFTGVDGKMFTFSIDTTAPQFAGLGAAALASAVQAAAVQTAATIANGIEAGQTMAQIALPAAATGASQLVPGTKFQGTVVGGGGRTTVINPATFQVLQAAERVARTSPNARVLLHVDGTGASLSSDGGAQEVGGDVNLRQGTTQGTATEILKNILTEVTSSTSSQGGTSSADDYNGKTTP